MSDLQVLRRTSVTITRTFEVDGTPTDIDSGLPTLTLTKPDGTGYTPLPTVSGSWSGRTTGQYRFVVSGQPDCIWLQHELTGNIGGLAQTLEDRVEWVGGLLFTESQLRALKVASGFPFASTAVPLFTDQQIMDARAATLDEFTNHLQFSPVPRFERAKFHGDGDTCLNLPTLYAHKLLSLKVNGETKTVTDYEVTDSGQLEAVSNYSTGTAFPRGRFNVVAEWVHGWQHIQGKGGHMAMLYAASQLDPSVITSASSVSLPTGETYTYEPSEEGRFGFQRFTRIKVVDRWLNDWRQVSVGIA